MESKITKCPKCNSQNIIASSGNAFATTQENGILKTFEDHHLCGNCGKVFSDNPVGEKLSKLSELTIHGENLLIEKISTEKVILKVTDIKNNLIKSVEFEGEEVAKAEEYYYAFLRNRY